MHDKKDIADLLEEVQTIVHTLRDEKIALRDQVSGLEAQLSLVKEEKTKESRNLQDINALLTKELQDTKVRLAAELQNNLLEMELLKKNEEIKTLEDSLSAYTSLPLTSLSVEEPIA
jgi:hypothetical protein